MPRSRLLTTDQTRQVLQVSRDTIYALVRDNRLSPVRGVGKGFKFTPRELDRFITAADPQPETAVP